MCIYAIYILYYVYIYVYVHVFVNVCVYIYIYACHSIDCRPEGKVLDFVLTSRKPSLHCKRWQVSGRTSCPATFAKGHLRCSMLSIQAVRNTGVWDCHPTLKMESETDQSPSWQNLSNFGKSSNTAMTVMVLWCRKAGQGFKLTYLVV